VLYWRANNRLILALLVIWAAVSYGCGILFVEVLNKITFFGLPLGFWVAQQGSIYVFVVLIFFYAWRMDKLDKKFHMDE
ncbi:MAG: DUF4212 domain-containing protein, partial [Candidatus Hydrogenedentes bacterium]|nr:DUF4212 domain-containing protein [Candidatus Hydrogenedentota bacterium]